MDIEQLRMSHKVVVRMNEIASRKEQKLSEDKDLNAMEQFSQFLNYSNVREIIDDMVGPILD